MVVDLAFVVGKDLLMIFEKLNPTSKIKKILRKRAIKNVEEMIAKLKIAIDKAGKN